MNLGQEFLTDLVLHEEMGEAIQHAPILATIPLEEHLIRTENARHAIHGHIAMLEDMQIVIPELILDKERHDRTYQTQETNGIDGSVQRQIADDVGSLIVLTHLIARR